MTPKDIDGALSALAALGLWPPWRQSAADRQAGSTPDTTKEATRQAWQHAAEMAYVAPAALLVACQGYAGERWPSPADVIALVVRARPAAAVGSCPRPPPESCNCDGHVSVAVPYTDAAGAPRRPPHDSLQYDGDTGKYHGRGTPKSLAHEGSTASRYHANDR